MTNTTVLLRKEEKDLLKCMDEYISGLKKQGYNEKRTSAKAALIRTGVVNKSGKAKKNIVSWG